MSNERVAGFMATALSLAGLVAGATLVLTLIVF
jgi:hypothetical protein